MSAAIGLGALAVGLWPLIAAPAPPPDGSALPVAPTIAHVAGMLVGYAVILLVALMARAPALEHGIGADVLTRWHARGGRIVMGLIVVHAWSAIVAWAQPRGETSLAATWHVLRLPWLMATTVGTALLVVIAAASARAARRRLSYERWHALHLLTYVAVALSFAHQLAGPDMAGHRLVQVAWALLYVQVFALVLRHRILTPLRQATRHRLRVAAVIPEGPDVVSLEIEGRHLDELRAEGGQFFRWRFLDPDHWRSAHPFSLSAPPTDTRLRLTVKALGGGSTSLQTIGVGTWVLAEGPYGALTAARRTRPDVLLIAGGVGITPLRALFETIPTCQATTSRSSTAPAAPPTCCCATSSTTSPGDGEPASTTSSATTRTASPPPGSAASFPTSPTGTSTSADRRPWPTPYDAPSASSAFRPATSTRNGSPGDRQPPPARWPSTPGVLPANSQPTPTALCGHTTRFTS